MWAQIHATQYVGARNITSEPGGMAYDEASGNLVVAMGILGLLVGTSDGEWTSYAVGRYRRTDFSFLGKTQLLLSSIGFWSSSLALSLSKTGVALVLSRYRRKDFLMLAGEPLGVLAASVVLLIGLFAVRGIGLEDAVVYLFVLSLLAILALVAGAILVVCCREVTGSGRASGSW